MSLLHSRHIIYRDLKPDNTMIDKDGHVKIIDFGFAKKLTNANNKNFRTFTNCGTIGYTAPEILTGISAGYSFPIDIWSFGILIAELLCGTLPFAETKDPMAIQEQIVKGQLKLNKGGIDYIARDLLQQILHHEPNLRISWDRIKEHRFFMHEKPADYWEQIAAKKFQQVPYTPNPMKYTYLLQNQYEQISNLQKKNVEESPALRQEKSNKDKDEPLPVFGASSEQSASVKEEVTSPKSKPYKLGDPIHPPPKPGSRAPTLGGDMVGMFGSGAGEFADPNSK